MSTRTSAATLASLLLLMSGVPAALAQTTLTVWMEAPAQVQAGSSFEVDVFLRGQTDLFDDCPGLAGFNSASLDQVVSLGSNMVTHMEQVAPADVVGFVNDPVFDPAGPALRGAAFFQGEPGTSLWPSWSGEPTLRFMTYRVDLQADVIGLLTIEAEQVELWFDGFFATAGGFTQDDPGVPLALQPLTVQIIPPPATPAVGLALLMIGARRRRA